MSAQTVKFSVFTKSWRMPLPKLGRFVKDLGFDGIELPVRPGFQVEPDQVATALPAAAKCLADHGIKIYSVAGPADEATIAACAEAGVDILRVMVTVPEKGYLARIEEVQREYDALLPFLDRHGVTMGVQNHCDWYVANAMGLLHLIGKYDPRHVAAVWDPAHNALEGEQPEVAIDVLWSHLCMVNLKNAYRRPAGVGDAGEAQWQVSWCAGQEGFASWPRVAAELKRRSYGGVLCLTAEYDDEERVDELTAADLKFAKSLF